ncbi:MAG: PASTA domain-containing protein [Bacteroidales bacterium]|nr:PASTA domain-containing protein [Candidatus Cryptobacteroides faecihippi]
MKCSYSGTGHVTSQIPKAGQRVEKGSTVSMTLK